jgi:UDP-N-acetylglucosamine/UDP-N-acetylgalactosamine diphosphorylase
MTSAPPDLTHRLKSHHQHHVLTGWDALSPAERTTLVEQLAGLDLAELEQLYQRRNEPHAVLPPRDRIQPLTVEPRSVEAVAVGEAALRAGQVAVLVVAGGQGSRLGSDRPKGVFPVGPVSNATLFQVHAEKVLALRRRYSAAVPFLVMTSPATHADTVAFFREHAHFGLPADDVHFFQQGTMPSLDLATGKLLLEKPGKLFLSPNGHGGTLTALADSGLLADLKQRGVRHIFYFQVDNPLVRVADPAMLGRHIAADAEVTSAVVFKEQPGEKVGILAAIDGRCGIIEYSDLPAEMTNERTATGELAFRAGNPAIHLFSVPFLEKTTAGEHRLAYHVARKKVPHYDPMTGKTVTPTTESALKFELFVFDALPLADRYLAIQVERADQFSPLKNATGADSIETVRRDLIARATKWLTAAGVETSGHPVEISPLFALDETELAGKIRPGTRITGPTYLTEPR